MPIDPDCFFALKRVLNLAVRAAIHIDARRADPSDLTSCATSGAVSRRIEGRTRLFPAPSKAKFTHR